jgi:uncharacterized protein DUF4337
MGHPTESLEHAEHVGHAGSHGGHDANGGRLSMWIGVTMASLGVILAFSAAKVGGERTELVKALVDQQHAHAKYQAQDIKHRTAVLSLRQLHATLDGARVNAEDMLVLAQLVDRYLAESRAASAWVDAYDPIVEAHASAQETYEHAQLAAEVGIVIASIALLLRRRSPWFVAILLGIAAVGILIVTYGRVGKIVHAAEQNVEESGQAYQTLRESGRSTEVDQALVDDVRNRFGKSPGAAPPAVQAPPAHHEK